MFRSQQNPFEDVIARATDENLTSENWDYMMDAWEKINESGENGPRDAVAALIRRLAHRNANVQLYTLELANAFSQNCGPRMHRELASRIFTEALLRLANDKNTHAQVKSKILERMGEWSEMFKKDPDLGIMEEAYHKLKAQNPNLVPPSKPHKREITELDRQKEEEELQMALAISLTERQNATATSSKSAGKAAESSNNQNQAATQKPVTSPHTTAATVSRVRALYDFVPTETGELAFKKGDIIAVLESVYKDWWKGSLRGQVGIFPLNYVEKLSDPTPEELQKEALMEAEVFAEIKNVEKLLALLSTSTPETSGQDSEEITRLYHSTLAIRPKLIELIGKYSQKKDEFVSLNEKFIKARRDYEALLESSMAAPPAGHYGRSGPAQAPYSYDGYAPPGGQPQRYFGSSGSAGSPHIPHGAYQPPPAHHDPPYPVTAQNTGRRQSSQVYPGIPDQQQSEPAHPGAAQYYQNHHPQQPQQRPPTHATADQGQQSTPQELATSVYDSPLGDRPPHGSFSAGPSKPPSDSREGREGRASPGNVNAYYYHHSSNPPPSGPSRPLSVGTGPHSQPPLSASHDVTPVSPPSASHPQQLAYVQHPYPSLTPGAPPPQDQVQGGYVPYSAATAQDDRGPQDYYRNSNNELFLPQGSRA
ncbi:hypothetical protein BDZ91DRAFT_252836 [Kalaharituber pfeilii]|nr:hypothetical protein BDZ91DRAFT_252836 [Kalaharituber pfeilii]